MVKRLLDLILALGMLVVTGPLFVVAAAGIWFTSPGPILYRARRVGRNRVPFTMYKFRSMHVEQESDASTITARDDSRVFKFGSWLRHLKIDELPQLWNVLKGEMSLVGPRPEDRQIVDAYYTATQLETLSVSPGLASPGSIYNYTNGEQLICGDDPQQCYVDRLLPIKLALDVVYIRRASLAYDLRIMARTAWVILASCLGKSTFSEPWEMSEANLIEQNIGETDQRSDQPEPLRMESTDSYIARG